MELQQLKLLAAHVRGLLKQVDSDPGHNRSLDTIAAIPGLANWPEVMAFPGRIEQAQLDLRAARRLAFRLARKHAYEVDPAELLMSLAGVVGHKVTGSPELWPSGPMPGVYVTMSSDAMDQLAERYTDVTDGALMYVERPWSSLENAIDLGDGGLWSSGLDLLPTGTLIMVGPVELDEAGWNDESERIKQAAYIAGAGHRVAVLVDTPNPSQLYEDVRLLATRDGDSYNTSQLRGDVETDGNLAERHPFARPRPVPASIRTAGTTEAIPASALRVLEPVLSGVTCGIVALGSEPIVEHSGMDLAASVLALTDHIGPAARIMPRHRSTPAKDWDVPDAVKSLPYLPSIESAVELGYKRLIVDPLYTKSEQLLTHANDILFLSRSYGADVDSIYMLLWRHAPSEPTDQMLQKVVAILGVVQFPDGIGNACDLYIRPTDGVSAIGHWRDMEPYLARHRVLRIEDTLNEMLASGLSVSDILAMLPRSRRVKEYLENAESA